MAYPRGAISSPLLAFRRTLLFLLLTFALMPLQLLAVAADSRFARDIPYYYHRQVCRIMGIRVERRGRQSRMHPTLYACNHASYWDITVLGSLIRGSFIAKSEIATWPFFSWLAKLQRSVFIDRRRGQSRAQRDQIARRLAAGDDLILFPEGTSDDGNHVLPFKSALFAVAESRPEDEPLTVQPVSITYTRLDGMPMGRYFRPFFAWYGDMDLAPHAWEAAGLGRLTVVVEFHPPVDITQFGSRKALAEHCWREVQAGVSDALAGRSRRRRRAETASGAEASTSAKGVAETAADASGVVTD